MRTKRYCFSINTYYQSIEILNAHKISKKIPILYFRYYLVNRLGIDWLIELITLLNTQFEAKKFKIYIEIKKNYGLFISLIEEKIDYLNVDADTKMLIKLKSIAKVNKVLINPNFSILDFTKSNNIKKKLENFL